MSKENNKLKQVRALQKHTDSSLQYFIDEVYRVLGNPIILYDIDWKILAYTKDVVTDDPVWNNHINTKTISYDSEITDIFKNEGFIDLMTRQDQVVLLSSEKLKYDRFFGKICDNEGLPIACVSVVASNKPFERDDLMVTETVCKMLFNEIYKIPYYQKYSQEKLDTFINMLINGDVNDKLYISGYINIVYIGLKASLYLAVADISQCDPSYSKLTYYRDLFKQMCPAFKCSVYSNYIVMIMSTDNELFYPKRALNRLNRLLEENGIIVGTSSRFENLYELSRYYSEAVKALNTGLTGANGQQIFVYDKENP